MTPEELIAEFEGAGGVLSLEGDKIFCEIPPAIPDEALEELRAIREQVKVVLRERQLSRPPALPSGVRLIAWQPKDPPIVLTRWSIVTNVPTFVETTLRQLQHAIAGDNPFLAGKLERQGVAGPAGAGGPEGTSRKSKELTKVISKWDSSTPVRN